LPQHINETAIQNTVNGYNVEKGVANYLWFKNTGSNAITLTLTSKEDATSGIGITVAGSGVWEGPAEIGCFYTKATGGNSTFEAVAFRVRG
jgi:hypothetical protein